MPDRGYRELADRIIARIWSGELPPGSRLPAADRLADGYPPATVQAALAWLVAHRWIVRTPGAGAHVALRLPAERPPDAGPPPPGPQAAAAPGPAGAPRQPDLDLARLAREVAELRQWREEHERQHREHRHQ